MSKRVNGKKGNRVRKHKNGSTSHYTKVRGCERQLKLPESVINPDVLDTGSI